MPLALADIDRDAQTLVVMVFERLERAAAHRHRQAPVFGDADFGRIGAERARLGERRLGDACEFIAGIGKFDRWHSGLS